MPSTDNYSKVYLETIMRADGQARLRARWLNPISGKAQNRILGLVSDFPGWNKKNKPKALQTQIDQLRLEVNTKPTSLIGYTMNDLIKDYYEEEFLLREPGEELGYSHSYIIRTKPVIEERIKPAFGHQLVQDIGRKKGLKPRDLRKWIDKLKKEDGVTALAPGSKSK